MTKKNNPDIRQPERLHANPAEEDEFSDVSDENTSDSNLPTSKQECLSFVKRNVSPSSLVDRSTNNRQKYNSYVMMVLTIVVIIVSYFCFSLGSSASVEPFDSNTLRSDIKEIRQRFPSQEEITWRTFFAGMNMSLSTPKPGVFLVLHDMNSHTAECVIQNLARKIKEDFFPQSEEIIWLRELNLQIFLNDPSGFSNYREKVLRNGIMVIEKLEKLPGKVARHLHSFCDTYNPVVKRAVYFFILGIQNLSERRKLTMMARETLQEHWKDLPENIFSPLITRLVENVVQIKDDSISSC